MRLPLAWLAEFVELPAEEALCEALELAGFEDAFTEDADGERVLELGLTPNRGDAASLLGLARELQALFGTPLRLPDCTAPEKASAAAAGDAVSIAIDAPDACFHYAARIVRGVRVGLSPPALRRRLEACGVRPVNGVVDATNAAMLELGQPLHAFDLAKLEGPEIRVRRAEKGELLGTLDGKERELDPRDLVIADARRPVALAGVMGGADSEVGEGTRDVLIESAHFHPTAVRLGARRHGLHTEASYRFERGVDRDGVVRAADRAARWIAELAGGEVASGCVEARGEAPPEIPRIELRVERSNRLLGLDLDGAAVCGLLERVGVEVAEAGPGVLLCLPPSHRNDLLVHQDLAEEIARIHGYGKIPITRPRGELVPARLPESWRLADGVRDALAAAGLVEVRSFPFVSDADLEALRLPAEERARALRLRNPIQDSEPLLRPCLVPSLLRLVRQNLSRQVEAIGLFEVAAAFEPADGAGGSGEASQGEPAAPPRETLWAVGALTAERFGGLWSGRDLPPAFFAARGIAEKALSGLGYVASLRSGGSAPYLHPGASVVLAIGDREIGGLGELHPEVAGAFGIDRPCAIFELNLSALLTEKKREFQFREVSREPGVRRDLAVLVDARQAAGELREEIRKVAGPDLASVDIFDRYTGRGVAEGRVSIAFRMVFQRSDRTLTDTEVSGITDRVVRALVERFGAEPR